MSLEPQSQAIVLAFLAGVGCAVVCIAIGWGLATMNFFGRKSP